MDCKLIADLHTHTLASTHAYSTLQEMCRSAAEKGLYAIAITDHGPAMPGSPGPWFFTNLPGVPLHYQGVLTLAGMEANVLDLEGTLDIPQRESEVLDWVVASVHSLTLEGLRDPTVEKCTQMWLNIAEKPFVNVIGHSGDPRFAYDLDTVIPVFGARHKLVEINDHSFSARPQNIPQCRQIALACKRYGVPIVVNSDAHIESSVGAHENAFRMLEEIDFPPELILNAHVDRLEAYLRQYTHIFEHRH